MQDEIDFDEIISNFRADPFDYMDVKTLHTGRIKYKVKEGDDVEGISGQWHHIPGTLLYEIERERNLKPLTSQINGVISSLEQGLDGQFVEAGEKVMTIKHPLKKREIIDGILRKVLSMYKAPERAKYFYSLDMQAKIDKHGAQSVLIKPGDEIFTMSLMKRDTPVYYDGEPGIMHSVYFSPGDSLDQGASMIGVCPEEKIPLVERIINRVKVEWN